MLDLDAKLKAIIEDPHRMGIQKVDEANPSPNPPQFFVVFSDGTVMGQLNLQVEKALAAVQKHHIDVDVYAPIKLIRETIDKTAKEKDAIVRVNINLYGDRNHASAVGRGLSMHKAYLQRPDQLRKDVVYDNPHILRLPNFEASYKDHAIDLGEAEQPGGNKIETLKKTISNVYSSLTRGQKLVGLEGDGRLKTPLLL